MFQPSDDTLLPRLPGVAIDDVDLSWVATARPDQWQPYVRGLGVLLDEFEEDEVVEGGHATVIFGDPKTPKKVLMLGFHQTLSEKKKGAPRPDGTVEMHFQLQVRAAPSSAAPDDVIELSQRMGGPSGLVRRLADGWPARGRIKVRATISFVSNATDYQARESLLPREKVRIRRKSSASRAVLSPVGAMWQVQIPGVEPPPSITLVQPPGSRSAFVQWSGFVTVDSVAEVVGQVVEGAWNIAKIALSRSSAT